MCLRTLHYQGNVFIADPYGAILLRQQGSLLSPVLAE